MEKISRRIFSLFIVALLVVTLIPMGAFAEENIAEPQALVSGETQTCRFNILYVDSSFNVGYNYGDEWNVDYTCMYATGHSGYNHTINCSVIKEQVNKAAGMVDSSWEIVGWSKEAKANPQVFTIYSGTTATQTTYTIYIVAKKAAPAVVEKTFTVKYMSDGSVFKTDNKTVSDANPIASSSADFNVISDVPTKDGYTFTGWVDKSNTAYNANAPFTLSASTANAQVSGNNVTLELYATWKETPAPSTPVQDEVTYTVTYVDEDGTTKAADDQSATNTTGSASFTANSVYEALAATKTGKKFSHWAGSDGNNYMAGATLNLTAAAPTLTLTAVWTNDGGDQPTPSVPPTDPPTPDEPGDKVSVPGMLKTANGKTGEGAIGSLKRGDKVAFTLKTNIGQDMMWGEEDPETGKPVQKLTQNKDTGLWEGAEYKLVVTDAMEGPMVIDGDIAVSINGKDGSKYVTYTSKTDTGFVLSIDCVAALNDGVFTVDDIGTAVVLVTYTAKVNDDAEDGAILKNTASVNGSAESVVTGDVTVPVEPPHTGGSGTAMFTVGGLVILAAAFVVLAVSRKKGKEN